MRHSLPLSTLVVALAFSACTPQNGTSADLLNNPLYAEYYYDDLVEAMVDIELKNPQIVADNPDLQEALETARRDGLAKAKEANDRQDTGTKGNFVQVKEVMRGEVLYVNNVLYFGPDFIMTPGPALYLYLSKDVDPRDAEVFPRGEDVEIAALSTPYGAQQFTTPELDPAVYRTLVIYDTALKRVYGFAQLAK